MPTPNENWLAGLFDEIGGELLRYLARRLNNEADAEDLAQEVYLRLLRVEDVSRIRDRRAFTLRVAANVAHEWRMLARNRLPHSSDLLESQLSEEREAAEAVVQAQQMKRLSSALCKLSPVCRAVLILNKRDGLTLKQIANVVGYSVPMVRKHLALGLVTVVEGEVAVASTTARKPVSLPAGRTAVIASHASALEVAEANTREAIAWRQRRLIFNNESLGAVIAEFNRYNRQQLVIHDQGLAADRISGVFDANDSQALVRFLAQQSDVRARELPGSRLLLVPAQQ